MGIFELFASACREYLLISCSSLYPLRPSLTTGVWKWDAQPLNAKMKTRRQPWEQRGSCDSYPGGYNQWPIVTLLFSGSAMAGSIEMSQLAMVEAVMKALQGVRHAPAPTISLPRFLGRPESPDGPTIDEWLSEFDMFVR